MFAVAFDGPARFDGLFRYQVLYKDIGKSQDRRHRSANLMAHVRQEFALGPVRGFGSEFRFSQFLHCPLAVGDVMSNGRCTDNLSVVVPDGRKRQGDIDQTSVLTTTNGIVLFHAPVVP